MWVVAGAFFGGIKFVRNVARAAFRRNAKEPALCDNPKALPLGGLVFRSVERSFEVCLPERSRPDATYDDFLIS